MIQYLNIREILPPQNYTEWGNLIFTLVEHLKERYGATELKEWFFEIWNEPNLKTFWTGSQADYFKLYQFSAKAIKKVHPDLKVGGPATAKNAWITPFINFCKKNKLPLDFISTHHYPTDAFGKPGDDTIEQLAKSKVSILQTDVKKQKSWQVTCRFIIHCGAHPPILLMNCTTKLMLQRTLPKQLWKPVDT